MKKLVLLLLSICVLFGADATVEIVKRMEKLPTIAIQDATGNGMDNNFKRKFYKILAGDLQVTTHFQVINKYFQSTYEGDFTTNFLAEEKPDLILRYKLEAAENGTIFARVRLLNASNGTVRSENSYRISQSARYPFLAHRITVELNDSIGAPSIAWMEKFVIFAKYTDKKASEIVIADYTLSFQKTLVKGGLNIFPKWANDNQDAFFYTSYSGVRPTLYHVDLNSGKRKRIIDSEGMLVASDVSRNGEKLLLTMAPQDQADIYMYDLRTKHLERITSYSGIDVSGGFVDNDDRIVFVSDRLGYPNIFSKRIGEKSVEQMVYHGRNNNSSSAYKNYIVYSSREKESEFGSSTFNLYLISTQTDYIRQLTATGKNLFPRFASDGESIIFIKEFGAQSALGVIRLGANKSFHFPLKVGRIQSIDW